MSTIGQNTRAGRFTAQKDEDASRLCEVLHTAQHERSVQAPGGPAPHVLARPPGDFFEEHSHEDPNYRTGRDRDPRNVRGREDPATQGGSRPTQHLREP